MKVLSVASEVFPFVKTGGLADVTGALPGALAALGADVRTLLPGYPAVIAKSKDAINLHDFDDLFGGPARLLSTIVNGVNLLVLDAPHLYDRHGNIYLSADNKDWGDNAYRFAALSWAGGWVGKGKLPEFQPDIVHAHDWQAGLVPAYLHYAEGGCPARSVMTIHNIAFQGIFPADFFQHLDLPAQAFSFEAVEYYGSVNYLKAGLALADVITTVSPTYAREITTAEFGMGLDGLIRYRRDRLYGIVNGIDTEVWNPETDPDIAANYTVQTMTTRASNRAELEARFELRGEGPILTVVSRLTLQKGLDVLADSFDEIIAMGCRLVVLGSGDHDLVERFRGGASRYPGRIGVFLGYDEKLAHLIQAGGDCIIIPSRFEPCGLTQLCALRYGSIPIAAKVGGLNDTIIDANDAALTAGAATGIMFGPVIKEELLHAIKRMLTLYAHPALWLAIVKNGMTFDVSWHRSAARYMQLYQSLL